MHKEGQRDGWMRERERERESDTKIERERERERKREREREWQHTKPVRVICMRQRSNFFSFQMVVSNQNMKSRLIQLKQKNYKIKCLLCFDVKVLKNRLFCPTRRAKEREAASFLFLSVPRSENNRDNKSKMNQLICISITVQELTFKPKARSRHCCVH